MLIVEITFWVSLALIAYAYVGYPLLLWVMSRCMGHSHHGKSGASSADQVTALELPRRDQWPFVSLVIAAYREEKVILERLQNALMLDYPADRIEVIVGCDGEEDLTGELVQSIHDTRIRLMQFPIRRGKASVLNDCIPQAKGDIVVLSDANTMMEPSAIRRLVQHFIAPEVGGVCGELILTDPITGCNVDGVYWRYEQFLKHCEGNIGALLGVNGGIYAIRKEIYEPIPTNTIVDDFLIGMRIHQRGMKLLYDAQAIAFEETAHSVQAEFHRRARIGAGGFQSLIWLKSLLLPKYGRVAFAFFSHKVLRWFCPGFMLAAIVSNAFLAAELVYFNLLAAQAVFYLSALLGLWLTTAGRWQKPLRLPAMFVSMNLALAVGFWRWLRGIRSGTWKRTARVEQPAQTFSNSLKSST